MRGALFMLAALPLLASCAGARVAEGRRLELKMDPPELKAGALIQVTATPPKGVELAWVSGTVKVFGAPVMAFKKDSQGAWAFKTMIPAFAAVSPGTYEAKAWGDALDGSRYEGSLSVEVK